MDVSVVVLRLVHVGCGAFWFGGALVLAGFVEPTAGALGAEGGRFMQRLMRGRLPAAITAAASLTILSGLVLYLRDANGLAPAWVLTGPGIGFLVGGLAGLLAFGVGIVLIRPAVAEIGRLAPQTTTDPPLSGRARGQEITLRRASWVSAVLLLLAVALMATARYL
jgi:hypothetical protein